MYEDIIKLVVAALIPMALEWVRSRYGDTDSKIKDKAFELILPILEGGIEKSNHLVVEYRFHKFLKYILTYTEIQAILNSNSPLHIFRKYKRASMFVEYNEQQNLFEYKERYKTVKARKTFKLSRQFQYFLYALIGVIPLMYSVNILDSYGFRAFPVLASVVLVFVPIAFIVLDESMRLKEAEEFMELTKNHLS